MLSRIVWDSPASASCMHMQSDGSVVVVSRDSIIAYSPSFHNSVDLDTAWIALSKRSADNGANPANPTIETWLCDFHGNNAEFKLLCFVHVVSCPHVWSADKAVLGALLTNGAMILFNKDTLSINSYDCDPFQIKLNGFAVLFNFTTTYVNWCQQQRISSNVGAIALSADHSRASITLVVGGGTRISIWSIERHGGKLLAKFEAGTEISNEASNVLTALHVEVTQQGVFLFAGTSTGIVNQFLLTRSSTGVNLTPTASNSFGGGLISSFVQSDDGRVHVVSNNKIYVLNGSGSYSVINLRYPVSGWTQLHRWTDDSSSIELCTSIDGVYHAWSAAEADQGVSIASRDVRAACGLPVDPYSSLNTTTDKSGLFGLDSDPFGLILVSAHKLNPVHDNSRDTQLNKGVMRSRIHVKWALSPFVDDNLASTVAGMQNLLTHVLNRYNELSARGKSVSLFGLAILFCSGVKSSKEPTKNSYPLIKSDAVGGSSSSSVGGEAVDSAAQDDTSDSEEEEDVVVTKKPRKSAAKSGSVGVKMDVDATSTTLQKQQEDLRLVLNKTGNVQSDAVDETLQRLLSAASEVVLRVIGDGIAAYGQCSAATDLNNARLFTLPSEATVLKKKRVLWQMLHLIILSLHQSNNVTLSEHWRKTIVALRHSIVAADCILTLSSDAIASMTGNTAQRKVEVLRALIGGPSSSSSSSAVNGLCTSALARWRSSHVETQLNDGCTDTCFVCGTGIAFDPHSFDFTQCASCGVRSERCGRSFQLVHQPSVNNRILRCSCCKAVVIEDQASSSLCSYCSVVLYEFV